MVHPLAQQLNGRLGKVLLPLRHVQVIHKDDILLTCRRPKHTLHVQDHTKLLLFAQIKSTAWVESLLGCEKQMGDRSWGGGGGCEVGSPCVSCPFWSQ